MMFYSCGCKKSALVGKIQLLLSLLVITSEPTPNSSPTRSDPKASGNFSSHLTFMYAEQCSTSKSHTPSTALLIQSQESGTSSPSLLINR